MPGRTSSRRDVCGAQADRLCRLAYVSRGVERNPATLRHLAETIAAISARHNAALGISGALAAGGGWFAQVLEGRRRDVVALFEHISTDPRHVDVRLLDFAPVARRRFAGWSMAWSGHMAPAMVRRAALSQARQEKQAKGCAAWHGRILVHSLALHAGDRLIGPGSLPLARPRLLA